MLAPMVAMQAVDLIVTGVWIGALALVLVAQGVRAWSHARLASRYANEAGRLAAAVRPSPQAATSIRLAEPAEPEQPTRLGARREA